MSCIGPELDVIRDAVQLACRAPSIHNSQPWRWVAEGPTLHLFADLTRVMTAADPEGREIYLSCGAVLDHMIVAMASAGWEASVQRFPDPLDPLHVAKLDLRPSPRKPTQATQARAQAIGRRFTDRRAYNSPPNWPSFEVLLRQTVIPHHVMFDIVLDHARASLAEASRLTGAIRANDPSYAAELSWWTAAFESGGGVPHTVLTSSAGQVDIRRIFPGTDQEPQGAGIDHSKIVVLSTHHEDARLDVLQCGEALSAVLLDCTGAGLATCTLTHMTELAPSRERVRRLIGQRGMPQLLIRIGQAIDDVVPDTSSRRPLTDVLEFR
ncbi:NAD(P)H nitroreductase [Mycobacterium sp. 2YAF39]|uniref:Acg family FMN-binding oxidoreductase n=1 Tax=Mycobacterium sp. 2YAF39 TaxID=3233033 RepID=UPI003F99649E